MARISIPCLRVVLLCLLISRNAGEWTSEWTVQPDFFDDLQATGKASFPGDSPVTAATTSGNTTYRLAHLASFVPFSIEGHVRADTVDQAAAILLAIYHWNHKETSPILHDDEFLRKCNIRLTTQFFDTLMDPVVSTSVVLERVKSREPPLAGIIGAYRSAVTSPVALVSGAYDLPQISATSTSTDLENREQYPYFSRVCPSTEGEAQAAVDYWKFLSHRFSNGNNNEKPTIEYVGVLFVRDVYGASLQRAFQNSATNAGIQTVSIPFGFSNKEEIAESVRKLQATQMRHFYVICFESDYTSIMKEATELGMAGIDHFWLFHGVNMATLHELTKYDKNSPLYKATLGIGILQFDARVHANARFPVSDGEQEPLPKPSSPQEHGMSSWRQAIQNPVFIEYVRSKIPLELRAMPNYFPDAPFAPDPTVDSSFLYDAITTMGIGMCRSTTPFFRAPDVAPLIPNITFGGLTGDVVFNDEGTRDYRTVTFTVWNSRPREGRSGMDSPEGFSFVPVHYYSDGSWKDLAENLTFIYRDGTAILPANLSPVVTESVQVAPAVVVASVSLLGLSVAFSLFCLVWAILNRREPVVCASQLTFLALVSWGSLIASLSVVPLAIQESAVESLRLKNWACMGAPWLFYMGISVASSAIVVKLWRLRQILVDPEMDRVMLTKRDFVVWCSGFVVFNALFLTLWTVISPWQWLVSESESTDLFGRTDSFYSCRTHNEKVSPYAAVIVVFHISVLVLACWWSYKTNEVTTEYSETKYIGYTLILLLESVVIVAPLTILLDSSRASRFILMSGSVLLISMVLLGLIFVPKIISQAKERRLAAIVSKKTPSVNGVDPLKEDM